MRRSFTASPWVWSGDGQAVSFYPFRLLNSKAAVLFDLGDYGRTQEIQQRCLRWAERHRHTEMAAECLVAMGNVLHRSSDYESAVRYYRDAIRSLEGRDGPSASRLLAKAYGLLGLVHYYRGEYGQALELYAKREAICREAGDQRGLAEVYCWTGNVHHSQREYAKAGEWFRRSLEISERVGDLSGLATAYGCLGVLYSDLGELERSLNFHRCQLALAERMGNKRGVGIALGNIGNYYLDIGKLEEAVGHFSRKRDICRELGDRRGLVMALGNLGLTAEEKGDLDGAQAHLAEAVDLARSLDIPYYLSQALYHLSAVRGARGESDAARLNEEALSLAAGINQPDIVLKCRVQRARLMASTRPAEAIAELEKLLTEPGHSEEEQALVRFEMFRITKDPRQRNEAEVLYKKLLERTPKQEYRRRLAELAG